MKRTWLKIEVGTPRMEDGVVVSTLYVANDGLRFVDDYLSQIFGQKYFQYIVSLDGVPFMWNLTATGSIWRQQ